MSCGGILPAGMEAIQVSSRGVRPERRGDRLPSIVTFWRITPALILCFLIITSTPVQSHGDYPATWSNANTSINDAYVSVQTAEQNGGDVSGLAAQLNTAITLIQRAQAENSTSPGNAIADLDNATQIAQSITQQAGSVSSAGVRSRLNLMLESSGVIAASIVISAIAYLEWDPVYRRLWLLAHGNDQVTSNNE